MTHINQSEIIIVQLWSSSADCCNHLHFPVILAHILPRYFIHHIMIYCESVLFKSTIYSFSSIDHFPGPTSCCFFTDTGCQEGTNHSKHSTLSHRPIRSQHRRSRANQRAAPVRSSQFFVFSPCRAGACLTCSLNWRISSPHYAIYLSGSQTTWLWGEQHVFNSSY